MDSSNSSSPKEGRSIFNKKAQEKLRGVDDMQKPLRLVKTSRWAVAVSVVVLVISIAIWGFFGLASSSISTNSLSYIDEGKQFFECYLLPEEVQYVKEGNEIALLGYKTTVSSIDKTPLSSAELCQRFDQYAMDYVDGTIVRGDWMYVVHLDAEPIEDLGFPLATPIETVITYERITPKEQLMRGFSWQTRLQKYRR